MTEPEAPKPRATEWLKARKAPPETPPERSRRRLFGVARTVVIAAVAYSAFRFVLGLDIFQSFGLATVGAIAVASVGGWFD